MTTDSEVGRAEEKEPSNLPILVQADASCPELLTANGLFDTNIKNGQRYSGITLDDIRKRVSAPTACVKEQAPFVIFSTCREYDGRVHAVQGEKGEYFALPGDVDKGFPTLEELDAALVAVFGDVERMIYSSASASRDVQKWRYIVPLACPVPGEDYPGIQSAAFDLMGAQGVTCDRALKWTGQPVFLPNVPKAKRDPETGEPIWYQHRIAEGPRFSLEHSCVLKRFNDNQQAEEKARQEALEKARRRSENRQFENNGAESLIDAYNRENSIDTLLIQYRYEQKGSSPHWRSPYQESSSYATRVYDEYWVSLSGSDAQAGIGQATQNGHRFGDAFDLYCHYEHQNDLSSAVRKIAFETYQSNLRPTDPQYFNTTVIPNIFGMDNKNDEGEDADADSLRSNLISRVTTMTMATIERRPEPREMISRYFPVAATSAVVSMGGVGKTTWATKTSVESMQADPELEVMVVSSEDGPEDYQAKIHNGLYSHNEYGQTYLQAAPEEVQGRFHVMNLKGTGAKLVAELGGSFVPSHFANELACTLKKHYPRVRLVIFETVSRFAGGEDNERMEALVTACDHVAITINGACVCVHHTGKGQARAKIVDLYSGRGGSTLGDNTRSMIVMTRLDDDYKAERPILAHPEDIQAGRVFEVKHVRNSYGPVLDLEYYVVRPGYCYGPVLEPLLGATEQDVVKAQLAAIDRKRSGAASRIFDIVKAKGSVPRKFFELRTRDLIDVTQAEGREIIDEMIAAGSLVERGEKEGRTTRKMLEAGKWS